mgnify:CR=1 FL=1
MKYELDKTNGSARRGRLVFERPQGTFSVETPAFMPVGTYGTVKGMTPEEVRATGAEILLAEINGMIFDPHFQQLTYNQRESLINPPFVMVADNTQNWASVFQFN